MSRQAKLGKKNGYWYSEAGGQPRYFGRIGEVSHAEAMRQFRAVLLAAFIPDSIPVPASVAELTARFLDWLARNRSGRTHEERARHLQRWCAGYGSLAAGEIRGEHLEAFIETLSERYDPDYVAKHVTSVKALFHKAVARGWLSSYPFGTVEPIRINHLLTEADLLTRDEVKALLDLADADLTTVGTGRGSRRRRPEEYRSDHPWIGFRDLLAVFHATGARTSELLEARVGDFAPRARQLVLANHKRAHTLKTPIPRTITLNPEAYEILRRRCMGREATDHVFVQPRNGRPWDRFSVAERFRAIRDRAGVRDSITIYSFRHLWISEMLMAGVDALLVAKMAGTSLAMIEKVYGHFRNQSYQDALARLDAERARRI